MNFRSAPSYSVSSAQLEHKSGAEAFWLAAAGLTGRLAVAPGFIRRFTFADGPHFTLIALWRTPADAEEFFSSDEHQAAMRQLFRDRWQYSHFAALWKMITPPATRDLMSTVRRRNSGNRQGVRGLWD